MKFLSNRVEVICRELKRLKRKQRFDITEWFYKEGFFLSPSEAEQSETEWDTFDCNGMHWYGLDRHYWFRKTYTVPKELEGKPIWFFAGDHLDDWDDGKNPQFLLFVNGEMAQGMDLNHKEVLLTTSGVAGEEFCLDLQAYSGTQHKEFRLETAICEIDPKIESLYYDLWVPLVALPRMAEEDKNRKDIIELLNETINYLDLRTPYNEAFYVSLEKATSYIQETLYGEQAGYSDVIATCIGHTHIDVAWLWTVAQTREKVARSFSTVLKLMDEYPNYKFMSSQPQLYVFLKERYPEMYEKVKKRIQEKRWEPEGGMWVEADCNLTSGESLVRQFMHGKQFFQEEFGVDNRILWLPDVFGYSGALPQIMKKCGIDYFMTTKLSWNQYNKIPADTLRWKGIDGSEVLTHFVSTYGIGQQIKDFFTTYNGMLHPDAIMGGWERYQNKEINNDILISYGYGDGGGGPTREMLETSKRMEQGIKGIPKVRQEFSRTYFEELEQRVENNKRLPIWEGEFYFEYHRGTYTSMARNKRSNRKSELGLMDLEFLSVLAENKNAYPKEALDAMWKLVLLNQFHDILPGSSIREVYDVTKEEYAQLEQQLKTTIQQQMDQLIQKTEDTVTIFNTIGANRSDVILLSNRDATALKDEEGTVYPIQQTEDGAIAYVKDIPSKGYAVFNLVTEPVKETAPFQLNSPLELETPYYKVKFHENGTIAQIYDKEQDRMVIKEKEEANLLRMYEDKPMCYDNWDIDVFYSEKYWDVTDVTKMEWTEMGTVRATLEIQRKESNSTFDQKIHFYADSRRIDFETKVDWHEHQTLLKVHFPVAIHSDEATFDVQFGNVKRKVHQNTSWDKARFESCGQKWMDFSEGHYGVSLLNDCKYGHSVKDSNIALTLVKSGTEPNPVADQEEHFFTYSLYPHKETWKEAKTVVEANKLNQPLLSVMGQGKKKQYSFVKTEKDNVIIETIKKAEDGSGVVIRLYESENSFTKAKLVLGETYEQAYVCNLLEQEEKTLSIVDGTISVELKPYEVVTIKLR